MGMISNIFNIDSIYQEDEDVLLFWQKKIFTCLFLLLVVIGIIPYVLSCGYALKNSEWIRIFIYTFIYLWTCGVAFLKQIPFKTRIWAGISGFYALGMVSMLSTGLMGSTRLYFMFFSILATVFSGIRGGLFSLLLNMATLAVFGVLYSGKIIIPADPRWIPDSMEWVILTGTFSFLCAFVTFFLAALVKALEISGKEFKHLAKNTPDIIGTLNPGHVELREKLIQAEKLKALGILAGSVAHDLNNILSGIATYPEVLMMDKNLDPRIRQGLSLIKDSGQKAAAVVSDLLTISRGTAVEMETININSVLERYVRSHDFQKIRDAYRNVAIELATEPELLNISGSYIHIEKVIMNLLLNAVEEVSGKNDGRVMITTSNSFIDPSIPGHEDIIQGEYAVLSVTDNGSGIDEKNLKKIFEPFFTKKEMGKSGTGLGLTIVWNAVQDHRGFINTASGIKGTRFDLLFPAVREEIPPKPISGPLDDIKGKGQMILVVDDLKDQQEIAVTILENLGYQAKSVDDGFAAIEFLKKNPVDLIILDMIMTPSISGLETYRMIKKIRPGQKAVIASGYSESDDVLTAQDLGAGSFVKKPYTILDMGIAVKEELEK